MINHSSFHLNGQSLSPFTLECCGTLKPTMRSLNSSAGDLVAGWCQSKNGFVFSNREVGFVFAKTAIGQALSPQCPVEDERRRSVASFLRKPVIQREIRKNRSWLRFCELAKQNANQLKYKTLGGIWLRFEKIPRQCESPHIPNSPNCFTGLKFERFVLA
jgi:hypothetical protein